VGGLEIGRTMRAAPHHQVDVGWLVEDRRDIPVAGARRRAVRVPGGDLEVVERGGRIDHADIAAHERGVRHCRIDL